MKLTVEATTHFNAMGSVDAAGTQYRTFVLASEEYGVDILRVQKINGWARPTRMPNTLYCHEGV